MVLVVDVTTVCAHVVLTFMAGCNWERAVDGGNLAIAGGLKVDAGSAFGWDGAIAGGLEASGGPAFGWDFAIAGELGVSNGDCDGCNFTLAGGLEVVAVPAFSWGSGTGRGLVVDTVCVVEN